MLGAVGLGVAVLVAMPLMLITTLMGSSSGGQSGCESPPVGTVITSAAGLNAAQLANAGTIIAVGQSMPGVGPQGETVAIATAMQESTLTNLPGGDRDSIGLFQQRPSQGWGSPAQVFDPSYAATTFYQHLLAVSGWQAMPVTVAAQTVQRSAYPDAYAKWQPLATQLVASAEASSGQTVSAQGGNGQTPPVGCSTPPPTDFVTLPAAVQAAIGAAPPQVQTAIAFALSKVGTPYQWGGTGPLYDCSGLVQAAYGAVGITLPRDTYGQVTVGQSVALSQLTPGDLLFPDPGHVQIYLGAGMIVEAPHTGAFVQVVPMWNQGAGVARRVVG
jgi:cell wall-associated NlpC family hydrolase